MRHRNSSSPSDLMVLIETTAGVGLLGWVIKTGNGSLTLHLTETGQEGWIVTVPWDDVTDLVDVTDFMTRTLRPEDA